MSAPAAEPLLHGDFTDLLAAARTVDQRFARELGAWLDEALARPAPEPYLRERIGRPEVPPVFGDLLECALATAAVTREPLRALPPLRASPAVFLRSPWRGVVTRFPVQHYLSGACDAPLALGRRRTHLAVLKEPYLNASATLFELDDFAFLQRLDEAPPVAELLAQEPGRRAAWLGSLSADGHVVWLRQR